MTPSFTDKFEPLNPDHFTVDPFTLFSKNLAVLSTGTQETGYNAMTIAWGTVGSLWERKSHNYRLPVMSVYVRPQRYTSQLMTKNKFFTVSFLNDRKVLGYLGTHSGKNENKYTGAGITPYFIANTVFPEEASLVFVCKKIYQSPLQECGFLDSEIIAFNYPENDYHIATIGQITNIYKRRNK